MRNAILLTFMSFLCLSITYADRDGRGGHARSSSDDYRYDSRPDYSSSRNLRYLTYEGGNDLQTVTLVDLEEVWVNETRQVRSTCTRQVPVTRRVCRDSRRHHHYETAEHRRRPPRRGHGRGHGHPPRQECRTETTYRTESYACYRSETVRTRRPDKRYHANVSIKFKNKTQYRYSDNRADFLVKLNRERLSLELQGQSNRGENLFFMKENLRVSQLGDLTEISGELKVLVFDKNEFLRPVRQQIDVRPEIHHGELVLKMGKVQFEKGFGVNLTLSGNYGRTLFNGQVPRDFMSIRDGRYDDESIVVIDLDRLLHGTLRRGEYLNAQLTVSLMNRNLTLLNTRHTPQLEQSVRASISVR